MTCKVRSFLLSESLWKSAFIIIITFQCETCRWTTNHSQPKRWWYITLAVMYQEYQFGSITVSQPSKHWLTTLFCDCVQCQHLKKVSNTDVNSSCDRWTFRSYSLQSNLNRIADKKCSLCSQCRRIPHLSLSPWWLLFLIVTNDI